MSEPAHAVGIGSERVESREMVADDTRERQPGYARLPVTTGCYALGLDGEFCVVNMQLTDPRSAAGLLTSGEY